MLPQDESGWVQRTLEEIQEPLPHYSKRGEWPGCGGRWRQEEAPDVSIKKRWEWEERKISRG